MMMRWYAFSERGSNRCCVVCSLLYRLYILSLFLCGFSLVYAQDSASQCDRRECDNRIWLNEWPRSNKKSVTLESVQVGLNAIYSIPEKPEKCEEFKYNKSRQAFTIDGLMGDYTQCVLNSFCASFPVSKPKNKIKAVEDALIHYKEIDDKFKSKNKFKNKKWREIVVGSEFNDWTFEKCERQIMRSGNADSIGLLLVNFLKGQSIDANDAVWEAARRACESDISRPPKSLPEYYREHWVELRLSSGFKQWLLEEPNRALRLSGSPPVIDFLVQEYLATLKEHSKSVSAGYYYILPEEILEAIAKKKVDGFKKSLKELKWGTPAELEAELKKLKLPKPLADRMANMINSQCDFNDDVKYFSEESIKNIEKNTFDGSSYRCKPQLEKVLGNIKGQSYNDLASLRATLNKGFGDDCGGSASEIKRPYSRVDAEKIKQKINVKKTLIAAIESGAISQRSIKEGNIENLFANAKVRWPSLEESEQLSLEAGLKNRTFPNEGMFRAAVKNLNIPAINDEAKNLDALSMLARKEIPDKWPKIKASDCGCAPLRDTSEDDRRYEVYGFYPYWLDLGTVNYSLFNRIGYYSLRLNKDGYIHSKQKENKGRHEKQINGLVDNAYIHNSKVDIVFEAPAGWKAWEEKQALNVVTSVRSLFGQRPRGKREPDGIIIYFPGYPNADADDKEKMHNVIKSVMRKLAVELDNKLVGKHIELGILVDSGQVDYGEKVTLVGGAVKAFEPISELLTYDKNIGEAIVKRVLVFFEQPYTLIKKRLRLATENEFSGEKRVQILRKIIPVVSEPKKEKNKDKQDLTECYSTIAKDSKDPYYQFQHELVYFKDNFGGVGFWPLIVAENKPNLLLEQRLHCAFSKASLSNKTVDESGYIQQGWGEKVCEFICIKRLYVNALLAIFAVILLIISLISWRLCWFRYDRYSGMTEGKKNTKRLRLLGMVVPIVIILPLLIGLMQCAPFWQSIAVPLLIAFAVITITVMAIKVINIFLISQI